GGLYDDAGNLLHDGLPAELASTLAAADPAVRPRRLGRAWGLNVCPTLYRAGLERWLAAQPRLTLLTRARVTRAVARGPTITERQVARPGAQLRRRAGTVIDATGTAEVVRLLDPCLLQGQAPTAAGGLILRLDGVAPGALAFPRGAALVGALRTAVQEGALPPECGKAWLDSGLADDEGYLKLFVPLR